MPSPDDPPLPRTPPPIIPAALRPLPNSFSVGCFPGAVTPAVSLSTSFLWASRAFVGRVWREQREGGGGRVGEKVVVTESLEKDVE